MNQNKIEAFLKAVKSSLSKNNRPGWVTASCPFAFDRHSYGVDKNPSFAISIEDKGLSRYHCFSCNSSGDLTRLLNDLRFLQNHEHFPGVDFKSALQLIAQEEDEDEFFIPDYEEVKPTRVKQIAFPESFIEHHPPAWDFEHSREYLVGRGVTSKMAKWLDIRLDERLNRVAFPIRDWSGSLMGFRGRSIERNKRPWHVYKYENQMNNLVWYGEHWLIPEKPVLMVESIFDLIKCLPLHRNTCCPMVASMSKHKVERLSGCTDVVTLYDWGKGGDFARKSTEKYLNSDSLVQLIPTEEQQDPGEMSYIDLATLLSKYLRVDTF